jgi:hypothetical protein
MSLPRLSPVSHLPAAGATFLDGWDLAQFGSLGVPGKARVRGGGIHLKFDHKKKKGSHGARPTLAGLDPQQFDLRVVVWTDAQLKALKDLCRSILPRSKETPTAHPTQAEIDKQVKTAQAQLDAVNARPVGNFQQTGINNGDRITAQTRLNAAKHAKPAKQPAPDPNDPNGKPWVLQHPQVAMIDPLWVLVVGSTPLEPSGEIAHGMEMTFKLLHYMPPKDDADRTPTAAPQRTPQNKNAAATKATPSQKPKAAGPDGRGPVR